MNLFRKKTSELPKPNNAAAPPVGGYPERTSSAAKPPPAGAASASAADSSAAAPPESSSAPSKKAADAEASGDENEELSNTVAGEVITLLKTKRDNLSAAEDRKQTLEGNLTTIEDSVTAAEADAKGKAALESEAAARLRAHRDSLAELDMQLSVKKMINTGNERGKSEMAKRLLEELQLKLQMATDSKNKCQQSFEVASKAVSDAEAKGHSNITAATGVKVAAQATSADAEESHSAMNVAMSVLQVRAKARMDDVNIAQRELDALDLAKKVIDAEKNEAEDLHQKVDAEFKIAEENVASHNEQSACRNRAHELEIKRAKECSDDSATLRDMGTRGLLMGEDRTTLEPAESGANSAADSAAAALAKALQAHDETKSKDSFQLDSLQAVVAMANKKLRKRQTILASLSARSQSNTAAMEEASATLVAATAPNNAVQERFETLKKQVDTLADALPECTAKLEEATRALETVRLDGDREQLPLKHAEQVESQVLDGRRAEEALLIKALAEARTAADEAAASHESIMEDGPDWLQLVKTSEARFAELDQAAQAETQGYKEAVEAVEGVKSDLAAIDSDDDGSDDNDDNDEENDNDDSDGEEEKKKKAARGDKDKEREAARTALATKIEPLELVMQDKKNTAKAAAAESKGAKEQLEALRAQQRATFCPAFVLVKQEIDLVDSSLASHRDREGEIMAEVREKVAAWMAQKETLGADLHRAQLLATAAEADVASNKVLAKSLADANKK